MNSSELQCAESSQPSNAAGVLAHHAFGALSPDEETKIRAIQRRMLDAVGSGDLDWACNLAC